MIRRIITWDVAITACIGSYALGFDAGWKQGIGEGKRESSLQSLKFPAWMTVAAAGAKRATHGPITDGAPRAGVTSGTSWSGAVG